MHIEAASVIKVQKVRFMFGSREWFEAP